MGDQPEWARHLSRAKGFSEKEDYPEWARNLGRVWSNMEKWGPHDAYGAMTHLGSANLEETQRSLEFLAEAGGLEVRGDMPCFDPKYPVFDLRRSPIKY